MSTTLPAPALRKLSLWLTHAAQVVWQVIGRGYFRSLRSRMLIMLAVALLLAEMLSGAIWYQQYRTRNDAGLQSAVRSMTQGVIATFNYMSALPRNYRQLVLAQQRELGAQFFISINNQPLLEQVFPANIAKSVIDTARNELGLHLDADQQMAVSLTRADELRVFNSGVLMSELPPGWTRFSLSTSRPDAPVLVLQLQMNTGEWLFLAAALPPPYDQLQSPLLSVRQMWFILSSMLFVLLFGWWLIRAELQPLANLARGARQMSTRFDGEPLPEQGSAEVVVATRAFNQMQTRLRAYLNDRDMLFTAISHDLKTPITRLRLRAELMEDDDRRERFERDLLELELMVKGALQSMKDTDIHENVERLDLMEILQSMVDGYQGRVTLKGEVAPIYARPLAIRRCLGNLLDNGVKYGGQVTITLDDAPDCVTLFIHDNGPGIPEAQLEKVFEPYFRLSPDSGGNGLGLSIARSIARAHGGDLSLMNDTGGGLLVVLTLLRNQQ